MLYVNWITRGGDSHLRLSANCAEVYARGTMTKAQGAAAVSHPIARYNAPGSAPAPNNGTPKAANTGMATSVERMTNHEYDSPNLSNRPCIFGRCFCMQEQIKAHVKLKQRMQCHREYISYREKCNSEVPREACKYAMSETLACCGLQEDQEVLNTQLQHHVTWV